MTRTRYIAGKTRPESTPESRARLQEMFAARKAPRINTDDHFRNHFGVNGSQFADRPEVGDYYRKRAEAAGVSTVGKVYVSQLARPGMPGDPEAWVESRGDVQRVCERRGWGATGSVNVEAEDREPSIDPDAPYKVNPQLVDNYCADLIEEHGPGFVNNQQELDDLKEHVANKLNPTVE